MGWGLLEAGEFRLGSLPLDKMGIMALANVQEDAEEPDELATDAAWVETVVKGRIGGRRVQLPLEHSVQCGAAKVEVAFELDSSLHLSDGCPDDIFS